jgi:hypothetical protein
MSNKLEIGTLVKIKENTYGYSEYLKFNNQIGVIIEYGKIGRQGQLYQVVVFNDFTRCPLYEDAFTILD